MIPKIMHMWHEIVEKKNIALLDEILAEDVEMHSPIVHTVQKGKEVTKKYLMGAAAVLCNDTFKYTRTVYTDNFALLEFITELNGVLVNGVDMISWNTENKITDFKVMIRPIKAVNEVHSEMGKMLIKLNS
ncbi:hypothetical protein SOPP22_18880 [Shewanella sp. OPT22]|nr:hypothetical protein SOPP22_18880 [Shewanella sp. OPT22]